MFRVVLIACVAVIGMSSVACAAPVRRDQTVDSEPVASLGPFTLESRTHRSGVSLNANYGFVRVNLYDRRVLLNGKPVSIPHPDDSRQRARIWFRDAWLLAAAPKPAVLVGDGGWWLVTEQGGRADIRRLGERSGDYIEWSDPAHRGLSGQRFSSREAGEPTTLNEAGWLVLDRRVLLDTRRLRWRELDSGAMATLPPGYVRHESDALGMSPDGQAVALLYTGPSLNRQDGLIVAWGMDAGPPLAQLTVDFDALGLPGVYETEQDVFARRIAWQTVGNTLNLILKPPATTP